MDVGDDVTIAGVITDTEDNEKIIIFETKSGTKVKVPSSDIKTIRPNLKISPYNEERG